MAETARATQQQPIGELLAPRPRSLWRDAWQTLLSNRFALAGGALVILIILIAAAAPLVAPYNPVAQDYDHLLEGPSLSHPMGTDNFGRDILSRIIYGGRISLTVGFVGTGLGVLIGVIIGILSGFYGGWVDGIFMRLLDIQLAFPGLLLAITIVAVLGVGTVNVIIAIGIFSIPVFARVLRGSIIALKESDFVLAAHAVGVGDRRLMFVHLLPNAVAPVIVIATLRLGTAILTAASLSFLGLGIRPPSPEWGAMLSDGRQFIQNAPWVAIFPGVAILLIVLALNLFGDGLRDAIDPKMRQ
ncbi:MAG TPA: ABC transporter permease [Thermomicrobiaceae bacterium]|nr:ABC transporter permease [Thermomicrobiaceae bacterium]